MRRMRVPAAAHDSWEAVLHDAAPTDKLLLMPEIERAEEAWDMRGHRAIGVVYDPEWERAGNYVPTVLPQRYDALLYIDESHALHPIHMPAFVDGEPPETYPTGM
jgi:erythromycin esterase-like protein